MYTTHLDVRTQKSETTASTTEACIFIVGVVAVPTFLMVTDCRHDAFMKTEKVERMI
jgi:hypothetical protein